MQFHVLLDDQNDCAKQKANGQKQQKAHGPMEEAAFTGLASAFESLHLSICMKIC
jgi:hypothetical protein